MRMHLAKLLVGEGLVSLNQIREAIERQRELKCGLHESLCDLGFISESGLVEFLGKQYGVPVMDIDDTKIDSEVIDLIPNETACEKYLIPVEVSGSDLTVAMCDPPNILLLDDLSFLTGKNIKPVVVSERSIKAKLAEYYSSDEAYSDGQTEKNSATSGTGHLPAAQSISDEDRRPIDEIISEIEQYKDSYISKSEDTGDDKHSDGARKEHQPVFDKLNPGGSKNSITDYDFDSEHYNQENTGLGLTHHESGEYFVNRSENADRASSLHGHKAGPLFKPDLKTEGQQTVTEEAADDFDKPMHKKGAERVIGFDFKSGEDPNTLKTDEYRSELVSGGKKRGGSEIRRSSQQVVPSSHAEEETDSSGQMDSNKYVHSEPYLKNEHTVKEGVYSHASADEGKEDDGLIEHELSEPEKSTSAKKEGEENKDPTSISGFNAFKVKGAPGVPDSPTSASPDEKTKEDLHEEYNLPNSTHYSNPSLREKKETDYFLPESAESLETEIEKADGVFFTNQEKELSTEASGLLGTDNAHPEETGRKRANFPKADEDSQKEINTAKTEVQSDIGQKDDDLTLEEEEAVTKSSKSIQEASGKKSRGSVLVVDDSPTVQKIVSIALKRKGYKVYTAGDGMKALSTLNEVIPDLIFVDVNMPHMDGYQLCKVIRNHGLTKNIPVVVMTGKTRLLDKMKWKRAGASGCIVKPFDYSALVEAAGKYVN